MPRQLLRDGCAVEDDWAYFDGNDEAPGARGLIVPFDDWLARSEHWRAVARPLGVALLPAHKVEQLAASIGCLDLIAVSFTGPSEGRGYTQGRLLRERYQFDGELRATGHVRRDQIFFLARCGFNSFELPADEIAAGLVALSTFSGAYQPANDRGLPAAAQGLSRSGILRSAMRRSTSS